MWAGASRVRMRLSLTVGGCVGAEGSEPGQLGPPTNTLLYLGFGGVVLCPKLEVGADCVRAHGNSRKHKGKNGAPQSIDDFHLVIFLRFAFLP